MALPPRDQGGPLADQDGGCERSEGTSGNVPCSDASTSVLAVSTNRTPMLGSPAN